MSTLIIAFYYTLLASNLRYNTRKNIIITYWAITHVEALQRTRYRKA